MDQYNSIFLKIENRRYYSAVRYTGIFFSFLIFLLGGYDISYGSELQRATTAFQKGDYDTALQIFTPIAEKEDMVAQFNLAKMYRKGTGVPKDL